jgi:hypothetical protein
MIAATGLKEGKPRSQDGAESPYLDPGQDGLAAGIRLSALEIPYQRLV